jgi:hypothetical protein
MQGTDLDVQPNPALASLPGSQERTKEVGSRQHSLIVPTKPARNGSMRKQAAPDWRRLAVISAHAGAALGAIVGIGVWY